MGGIDLDLPSQSGDAQVDGAIERVGLAMRPRAQCHQQCSARGLAREEIRVPVTA
jgi:hypothetical protein